MKLILRALEEPQPGERWAAIFREAWPGYRDWFFREGDAARPGYLHCERALRAHMPELLPLYQRLVELAGGGDAAARFLSLYRPVPYITGCSQAVWTRGEPFLVRNYDFEPRLWDALLLHTKWTGRSVVAMSDCLWGVLDGVNDAGLAVSLSFGGSRRVGDGFGIPLVLRYVLEFCASTPEAVDVLGRIPVHMAYNVTVLDEAGDFRTVHLRPGGGAKATRRPIATNHQDSPAWHKHAVATGSIERESFLKERIRDEHEDADRIIARFLEPPLFSDAFHRGWGTLYTAVYRPRERAAEYLWPGRIMRQEVGRFEERALEIRFGAVRADDEVARRSPAAAAEGDS